MNPISLLSVATLIGTPGPDLPDGLVTSIGHDTRNIVPGTLFFAIKGETHNGHDHLPAATNAVAAVVRHGTPLVPGLPMIFVDDTRVALGKLAVEVRKTFTGKVIAVAGSNGKTGTKNLIHTALTNPLVGSASPKSFNNDIGVPTAIFAANPADDFLVLELGTNHPGEIETLSLIAQPDIAVVTSIGEEHLEFLTDLDGVRAENAKITAGLSSDGAVVCIGDDPLFWPLLAPSKLIRFGFHEDNDVRPLDVQSILAGTTFRLSDTGQAVSIPLPGRHNAANALAAILVARFLGIDDAISIANLQKATAAPQRLQIQTARGITILNDAYNANPHSMRAALATLSEMNHPGRKIAVLGDMRELGDTAPRFHDEIGRLAGQLPLAYLFCVGPNSLRIAAAAHAAGMNSVNIHHFTDSVAAATAVAQHLRAGDLVLLKASRGIQLEKIADAILSG